MTVVSTICMISDEPPERDRRVQAAILERQEVRLVDLTSSRQGDGDFMISFMAAGIFFRAFLAGVPLALKLRTLLASYPDHGWFSGLSAAWRWMRASVMCRRELACYATLYANDLYSAAAAVTAAAPDVEIIYDSHEIQFHRNRKTGWLRILVEAGLERIVLERANKVHLVNNAIGCLMKEIYGTLPSVRVIYNDFYTHHYLPTPPNNTAPAFVYVGRGLSGRMLEILDRPLDDLGVEMFIYPLGAALPPKLSGMHWIFGPDEYEQDLLARVRSRRCMMWCCHDNNCMSYSYSLPNKFFQALAVGMPVVARRGTYLAKIVDEYSLGLIYEDGVSLVQLVADIRGPLFDGWRENILRFREIIRNGSIMI